MISIFLSGVIFKEVSFVGEMFILSLKYCCFLVLTVSNIMSFVHIAQVLI
jgi:hypothetical protein